MNEDKLKNLWKEINQPEENKNTFSEEQIQIMLQGKANDIFTRISKNLKIGMVLLGFYMILVIWGMRQIYFNDSFTSEINLSLWYITFDLFADFLVISSFIYFVISFKRLNISAITGNKVKDTIKSAIKILKTYRKFFYVLVAIITSSGLAGFFIGASYGMEEAEKLYGIGMNDTGEIAIIIVLILFAIIFLLIIALVWYVFKKLYGNYIEKLEDCYNELIESE